jgi:hypothetical protein
VLVVGIRVTEPDVTVEAMDEQVHAAEAVGEVFGLLSIEGQAAAVPGKEIGLNEHAARATAGVEDFALRWLEHGDQELDDTGGEYSPPLVPPKGELADEAFVDASMRSSLP